jgi:hypothetical protein
MSEGVRTIAVPTKRALLMRFLIHSLVLAICSEGKCTGSYLCVSIAAFGAPVVPVLVNASLRQPKGRAALTRRELQIQDVAVPDSGLCMLQGCRGGGQTFVEERRV